MLKRAGLLSCAVLRVPAFVLPQRGFAIDRFPSLGLKMSNMASTLDEVRPSRPASVRSFSTPRLNVVLTDGMAHLLPPASRDDPHLYRQPPSGHSRIYRVTHMCTDGVYRRESADTRPVVLKVDKDGNLKREASTFRDTVAADNPAHTPGAFNRTPSVFRNSVGRDDPTFPPEAGRYHLYVCFACPWSQRALIAWALKGLQGVIGMSATHPTWQKTRPDDDDDHHYGWAFADPEDLPLVPPSGHGEISSGVTIPDPLHGFKMVRDIYDMAAGAGTLKKYTVPILWDEKTKTVVNNESSDIIHIFNTAFNDLEGVAHPELDLAPQTEQEKAWAQEVDGWMYDEVCNGVYKAGFAKSQVAYDRAVTSLFDHLDKLEEILSTRRYLAGDRVTLSDVRVFPSLVRFDEVYNVYFKCNKKRLVDYPNVLNYVRDLYQRYPVGFADTTNMDHIRKHYYTSHVALNTYSIIPAGPDFVSTLKEPHDRDRAF